MPEFRPIAKTLKTREKELLTNSSITPYRALDGDQRRLGRLKGIGAPREQGLSAAKGGKLRLAPRDIGQQQNTTDAPSSPQTTP